MYIMYYVLNIIYIYAIYIKHTYIMLYNRHIYIPLYIYALFIQIHIYTHITHIYTHNTYMEAKKPCSLLNLSPGGCVCGGILLVQVLGSKDPRIRNSTI